jgi:hypothetical protein
MARSVYPQGFEGRVRGLLSDGGNTRGSEARLTTSIEATGPITARPMPDSPAGFLESGRGYRACGRPEACLADGRCPRTSAGQNQNQPEEDGSLNR